MSEHLSENGWPPTYIIKKHKRARYVKLRTRPEHGLEITTPYRFNLRDLPAILEKHKTWIIAELIKLRERKTHALPKQLDLKMFGHVYTIQYMACQRRLKLTERPDNEIVLLGNIEDETACKKILLNWIKQIAKKQLELLINNISHSIQLPYTQVIIRDQKTRWGSCTSKKSISLNYKLIFLPVYLARHVIIHELCHTKHLNHSDKFWRLVAEYDLNWQKYKRELKQADAYVPRWI